MLKIMLISMPYTMLTMPSIGVAQLQAVVHQKLPQQAVVDSCYPYLDFAEFVGGVDAYEALGTFETKGLVDWMFHRSAFEGPDNLEAYRRFFFEDGTFPRKLQTFTLANELRNRIDVFLDGLIERCRLREYDVVGFTSMMSQNIASFALAQRLKRAHPNVITVLGGPNTEHPMGKTIVDHVMQIDYVFSGEALVSFPSFLRAVIAGDFAAIAALRGVHARPYVETKMVVGLAGGTTFTAGSSGQMRKLPILSVAQDAGGCGTSELEDNSGEAFNLNEMPMLDYSEYLQHLERTPFKDRLKPDLIIPFQTSTGCWWADKVPCSFCGLTPHAFRQMTVDKARTYIAELIERYRGKFSVFEATDPCMPIEYPKQVFTLVNQDKAVVLQYEVKAKMPVEDMIDMARANVVLPQPGIESLSTRTLKIMRKGVTAFNNVQFLKYCTEYGLYPIWNFLYGFPNSDYDELETGKLVDDILTLCHLPPPSASVPIAFQRYSEYFKERDKYGLVLRPLPHYSFSYPFDESVISELAYSFFDAAYSDDLARKHEAAIKEINEEVVNWMFKFRDDIPKLYFSEKCVIYDTRFEEPAKYRISEQEREILRFLNEPRSAHQVAKQFEMSDEQAEEVIERFTTARLLFSERDKHLNIVCEQCELTADIYKNYYVNFVKNSSTAFQ